MDLDNEINENDLLHRLNAFLPRSIAILSIKRVNDNAHARYDARERSYEYRITLKKNPLLIGYAYHFFKSLDVKKMNEAALLLYGVHDFTCFSKEKTDVNHFVCHINKAKWKKSKDLLIFEITANRFLRGMVRAVVGTLLDVGTGKISIPDFQKIMESKDRKKAGMNVPAEGLYLKSVKYKKGIFMR